MIRCGGLVGLPVTTGPTTDRPVCRSQLVEWQTGRYEIQTGTGPDRPVAGTGSIYVVVYSFINMKNKLFVNENEILRTMCNKSDSEMFFRQTLLRLRVVTGPAKPVWAGRSGPVPGRAGLNS